jgi:uncharacterized membrane protein
MTSFLHSVRHNIDHYVAFLIRFFVIAAAWRRYHGVFRYIQQVDTRVRNLNVLWLLTIILTPFATRLLTTPGRGSVGPHALQFGFYALLQVLSSAALLLMVHHVIAHGLQASDTPPLAENYGDWESYGVMLAFGVSIPLFFLTSSAWVIWIVVPVLVSYLSNRRRRRGGQARGPEAT